MGNYQVSKREILRSVETGSTTPPYPLFGNPYAKWNRRQNPSDEANESLVGDSDRPPSPPPSPSPGLHHSRPHHHLHPHHRGEKGGKSEVKEDQKTVQKVGQKDSKNMIDDVVVDDDGESEDGIRDDEDEKVLDESFVSSIPLRSRIAALERDNHLLSVSLSIKKRFITSHLRVSSRRLSFLPFLSP